MCWGPYFSQKNLKSENGPTLLLFNKISKKSYIGQRKGPAHGGRRGGCILVCKAACAMYILENILEYESARDPLYSERYSRIIRQGQFSPPTKLLPPGDSVGSLQNPHEHGGGHIRNRTVIEGVTSKPARTQTGSLPYSHTHARGHFRVRTVIEGVTCVRPTLMEGVTRGAARLRTYEGT